MKSAPFASRTAGPRTVLVIDDDPHILEVIEARLTASGFAVAAAPAGKPALKLLKARAIDLAVCDVKLPDMDGFDLFEKMRAVRPELPVIFLTAFGTIPDAVQAMKSGAVEYLTKPFDGRDLVARIHGILDTASPVVSAGTHAPTGFRPGGGAAMKTLFDTIERVAAVEVNVLILGESGVGKERVARMIHDRSPRCERPFVTVDCGATPDSLLESELFGHVRGAFTHAVRDKKGLVETADSGTLFLDEIGNISPEMQMRLLRFLEERTLRRIGDIREIAVDCRVLAATNARLAEDIRAGRFRQDLYYRLRGVTLTIPPLRERREDIPGLAAHFAETFCDFQGIPRVRILPQTLERLRAHAWPGNVRELKNAVEAGVALCDGEALGPENLQLESLAYAGDADDPPESLSLEDSERNAIVRALKQSGGVQKTAAELLGISRRAIHYKIKKYGIKP